MVESTSSRRIKEKEKRRETSQKVEKQRWEVYKKQRQIKPEGVVYLFSQEKALTASLHEIQPLF